MAIDNENEDITDFIIENMGSKDMRKLCEIGIYHKQPNARLQLVRIIANNNTLKEQYLSKLSNDKDEIVRKKVLVELGD